MFKKRLSRVKHKQQKNQKFKSETEVIAYRLYHNRQMLGRAGDQSKDWHTAEHIANNPIRYSLFKLHQLLIRIEKYYWEPLLNWANNQALLSLLGMIGNVGILLVAVTYIGSEKQRREAEIYQAWQVITSAHGQSGSGGRRRALEFLNASPGANWRRKFPWFCAPMKFCLWPGESLDGINLAAESHVFLITKDQGEPQSPPGVYLNRIQLPKASLVQANLTGATLWEANLVGADLWQANLTGVGLGKANMAGSLLMDANLKGADLLSANLAGGDLSRANLVGAYLWGANLKGAVLVEANLAEAILVKANLEGANLLQANLQADNLREANLAEANLREANLAGDDLVRASLIKAYLIDANLVEANLLEANLQGAYLEEEQVSQALLCRTQLPEEIKLDPNRDCEELESEN